ncbi:MAG TPA: YtxH domain-containing protein [Vicinamibacteria bacterium]|nr:YtxH domain-containing protein [Vicinamibacteria bacterium]
MVVKGRESGSFLSGLLLGATLGAMSALVLAPKSGKRLRRDIAREAGRTKRRAGDSVEQLVARSSGALEAAKDAVAEAQQTVRRAARTVAR